MRKQEQLEINNRMFRVIDDVNNSFVDYSKSYPLRSCNARVFKGERYIVLRSYHTNIAVIDTKTDTLYDFLRYVYGYTATSAQHIAKFNQDYGAGKWGCEHRLTYRNI